MKSKLQLAICWIFSPIMKLSLAILLASVLSTSAFVFAPSALTAARLSKSRSLFCEKEETEDVAVEAEEEIQPETEEVAEVPEPTT